VKFAGLQSLAQERAERGQQDPVAPNEAGVEAAVNLEVGVKPEIYLFLDLSIFVYFLIT
jgi:hypothetical protein